MSAASTTREAKATAAGIVERPDTQQRVIPESRRADGSIRKERKVRPGFTPVEDVVRYRPARAREAEEARKRGIPGSVALSAAPTSSSSSPSRAPPSGLTIRSETADSHSQTWRSSAARPSVASNGNKGDQPPRGKFAPLVPPRQPKEAKPSVKPSAVDAVGASITDQVREESQTKSWRNSRLRRQQAAGPSQDEAAAVQDAWDEDGSERNGSADEKAREETKAVTSKKGPIEDDLAAQLDSLRIDRSDEPKI